MLPCVKAASRTSAGRPTSGSSPFERRRSTCELSAPAGGRSPKSMQVALLKSVLKAPARTPDRTERHDGAIEDERGRLQAWLGDIRVRPRFRTPLERELGG